jgi:YbbR domain-containing protein
VRRVILHNFWLKLISVGLGALIWFALHSQVQSDSSVPQPKISGVIVKQRFKLPISALHPEDGRIFRLSQREATLDVVGEESVLRKLVANDFKVYVDLTDFNPGEAKSETLRAHVPPDVIIIDLQPKVVLVELVTPATNLK